MCNAPVSLGHVVLAHLKFEGRLGTTRQRILLSYMDFCFMGVPRHLKKQLSCNSQCLSHYIALFIVVGDETRIDSDNDTLIEGGSGMCWTSGPPGMSDHGKLKKTSEIWICAARCRLRKVSGNTVNRQLRTVHGPQQDTGGDTLTQMANSRTGLKHMWTTRNTVR